jgi:hypothetical protein
MTNKSILVKLKRRPLWGLGLIYKIDELVVVPEEGMEDSDVYEMAQQFMKLGAYEVDVLDDF